MEVNSRASCLRRRQQHRTAYVGYSGLFRWLSALLEGSWVARSVQRREILKSRSRSSGSVTSSSVPSSARRSGPTHGTGTTMRGVQRLSVTAAPSTPYATYPRASPRAHQNRPATISHQRDFPKLWRGILRGGPRSRAGAHKGRAPVLGKHECPSLLDTVPSEVWPTKGTAGTGY